MDNRIQRLVNAMSKLNDAYAECSKQLSNIRLAFDYIERNNLYDDEGMLEAVNYNIDLYNKASNKAAEYKNLISLIQKEV